VVNFRPREGAPLQEPPRSCRSDLVDLGVDLSGQPPGQIGQVAGLGLEVPVDAVAAVERAAARLGRQVLHLAGIAAQVGQLTHLCVLYR
jgi:hypothetical protein